MTALRDKLAALSADTATELELEGVGRFAVNTSGAIGEGFVVSTQFERAHGLPGVHTLLQLCGLDALSAFPDWMQGSADAGLTSLTASVANGEIGYLSLTAAAGGSWSLIDNFLVVENLSIGLEGVHPFDATQAVIDLSVYGRIVLGSAKLDVALHAPDVTRFGATTRPHTSEDLASALTLAPYEFDAGQAAQFAAAFDTPPADAVSTSPRVPFTLEASLAEPAPLADLFAHFGWHAGELFGKAEIAALELRYQSDASAYHCLIDVAHALTFEALGARFELQDIYVVVDGDEDGIAGELGVALDFAETRFALRAQCSAADAGWLFNGEIGHIDDDEVELDDTHNGDARPAESSGPAIISAKTFADDVERRFGVTLPDFVRSAEIASLGMSFHTGSGDFQFSCDCRIEIGSARVEALLTIAISHQGSARQRQFGGYLTVTPAGGDPLLFDLAVHDENSETTLVAAFSGAGDGVGVDIGALVESLAGGRPDGLPKLQLTVPAAYLIHRSNSTDPTRGLTLFGIDIEGGLDLSTIRLPGLPLAKAADGGGLRIGFKALLASTDTTVDEALAALAAEHGLDLPAGDLSAPGRIDAMLHIGDETRQLPVPINKDLGSLQHGGLQAAPNASESKAVAAGEPTWFKIHKAFGPVQVERIGLLFGDGKISALLDASLGIAGLTVALDGLTVSSTISPIEPHFSLHGLGIDYRNEAVEIGGALLHCQRKYKDTSIDVFAGEAVVHAKQFTLTASGVYAAVEGDPSLFLYAVLDYPLGGPAFFFVTGLAAGLGFNRTLTLPAIDQVAEFPLIKMALSDTPAGNSKPAERNPMLALEQLEPVIPPAIGEYFVAAGVRFSSFKMVDSFALLAVRFGHRFEIDLLGLSTLIHPPPAARSPTTLAEIQLAIKATFVPEQGVLTVEALLTPESYFLSRDCQLSGGFAFFSWFKDQTINDARSGDFVATLGGYHPQFQAPTHYPRVPRLALTWRVNEHLTIKGSAYYAITAHALMAGGTLNAVWQTTDVRAWFSAAADFLLSWQPYHYDARMQVAMGAEVTIHVFGTHQLNFDASAQLHLWGPEFAGNADINVKVLGFNVSFHVAFGEHAVLAEAIKWASFRDAFLPQQLCSAGVRQGLLRVIKDKGDERWIVDPTHLAIAIESAVPLTRERGASEDRETRLGIAPMGISPGQFSSSLTIDVYNEAGEAVTDHFSFTPITKLQPAALWGRPKIRTDFGKCFVVPPDVNGAGFIDDTLNGFSMTVKNAVAQSDTVKRTLCIKPEVITDAFAWQQCTLDPLSSGKESASATDPAARSAMLRSLGFGIAASATTH